MSEMFNKDPFSAFEALEAAQWLAFAPLAFQATAVMLDKGLLSALEQVGEKGASLEELVERTGLSSYAVRVLMEAALGLRIIWRSEGRYYLGRLGWVLLRNEMTKINFNFTKDVCYQAAAHLGEALTEKYPAGLRALGHWPTIYEGLSNLPEPALSSWHEFDHFYSNQAFDVAINEFQDQGSCRLLDVGCNTGKWAQLFLSRYPTATVGLVDLKPQLKKAKKRLEESELIERAYFHEVDVLQSNSELPSGYDVIWMSQFLDCFSDEQIISILKKAVRALNDGGQIYILELFWDRQRFEAAALSLQMTSLYFTCVANGNSQMYESAVFIELVRRAGLKIEQITDGVGGHHTLLRCVPK
ncbi:class I SAM-dependent methyltransferase [Paenalcaligenes hominis]|uniref:class I SAM-dependent methyltransferase n=1 Tax=Paenalcaligenes hominis TaxID=643674 RepID=UPI003526BF86